MENIEAVKELLIHKGRIEDSLQEVNRIINYLIRQNKLDMTPSITPYKIFKAVSLVFGISKGAIVSDNRLRNIVLARNAVVYFLREYNELSYPKIGEIINRHHATILNSLKVFQLDYDNIKWYAEKIEETRKIIIE